MATNGMTAEPKLAPLTQDAILLSRGDVRDQELRTEAGRTLAELHRVLRQNLPADGIAVFEAGGGSTSYLPTDIRDRTKLTVVDIDTVQVQLNTYADTVIQGDIQTHRFADARFDLVVCYNVIEHLPDVEAAFEGFAAALKPGGLVLIGAPYPTSLSGFVTRFTPHWFHVAFCRYALGWETAGQPGYAPFPTHFHPLVDPKRLAEHAAQKGFSVVHSRIYESPRYPEMRARRPWLARVLDAGASILNIVLATRRDVRDGDYHLVLRKNA
ncbi:MAG: methyltransferase domain-containing protein [Alphaproteobacteria bacterium]